MSRLLGRLGAFCAAHPWRVIASWLGLLVALVALNGTLGSTPRDDYRIPGSDSWAGIDLLTERFPAVSGTNARVVVHDPSGAALSGAQLSATRTALDALPHTGSVPPPRLSTDRDTALFSVQYDVPVTAMPGTEALDGLRAATAGATRAGLQVDLGGQVPENISEPNGTAEAIGIGAALVIMVIGFGSVVAAGLPIAVALAGIGAGSAAIGLLSAVIDVSRLAPTVATMVGLGVGIDYAMLVVRRFAEELGAGHDRRAAATTATATAGASTVHAGLTVLVSLLGLGLAGLPTYATFGYATLLVVGFTMLAAVSLVPALCALAGPRLLSRGARAALSNRTDAAVGTAEVAGAAPRSTPSERWARRVGRRPVAWGLAALTVLLLMASPVLAMRTWPQDAGSQPTENTARRAHDRIAAEFGPGANAPLVVVVDLLRLPGQDLGGLGAGLAALPGVAGVSPATTGPQGDVAVLVVEPTTGPQDERTGQLLDRVRAQVPPGSHVTGLTATFADIAERLASRLWLVIAFVVLVSVLLLTVMFRAPLVALKAAAMNLLSVGAAYGAMVAIFQWGWGTSLLGLPQEVPVSSWVPILMFAVLFGLSMDYEVFLLGRVREEWLAGHGGRESVVRGLSSTGRVISTAAAIMVAVFIGFALDPDVTITMIGVGMAVAIAVDATIIRLVLVPAAMALLGDANWWLPGWLDRLLPRVALEPSTGEPNRMPAGSEHELLTSSQ